MSQHGSGSELDAIASWRRSMLERVLITCFVLLSLALLFSFWRPRLFEGRILAAALLPGWLLVTAGLWPKASLGFRQVA
jgi:hypothetical protein